jgi:hypothetical protein
MYSTDSSFPKKYWTAVSKQWVQMVEYLIRKTVGSTAGKQWVHISNMFSIISEQKKKQNCRIHRILLVYSFIPYCRSYFFR